MASIAECLSHNLPLSWMSFIQLQLANPLIWIIDTAPMFLGLAAFFIGDREDRLLEQNRRLEDCVKERSQEVYEQKLFYEVIFNNSPAAIVTLDAEHKIVAINPSFKKLFEYSLKEVVGIDLDAIILDEKTVKQAKDYTKQVLDGESIHGIGDRRRKDGSYVCVDIFGQPIIVDGKRIGVLGMYTNITERKKAEDAIKKSELRYRVLFHNSPVSLWEVDFSDIHSWIEELNGSGVDNLDTYFNSHPTLCDEFASSLTVIDVNQATVTLFGAHNKQQLVDQFRNIFSDECAVPLREIMLAFSDGQHSIEKEFPHKKLSGDDLYAIVRLSVIPGYEENWERVHVSIIDISERKWAEDRLKYLSLHDTLTGLYNRTFFETEIARMYQIKRSKKKAQLKD